MGRQAIGAITYNQLRRIDILLCHMVYLFTATYG